MLRKWKMKGKSWETEKAEVAAKPLCFPSMYRYITQTWAKELLSQLEVKKHINGNKDFENALTYYSTCLVVKGPPSFLFSTSILDGNSSVQKVKTRLRLRGNLCRRAKLVTFCRPYFFKDWHQLAATKTEPLSLFSLHRNTHVHTSNVSHTDGIVQLIGYKLEGIIFMHDEDDRKDNCWVKILL